MAESQESSSFCSRAAALSRRHSADVAPPNSDRFHPYLRQFSDGAAADGAASWDAYQHSMQFSYPEVPAMPGEPSCFQAQSYAAYSSSSLQQASCRPYPSSVQSHSTKYPVEGPAPPSLGRSPPASIFPKPIYSYSILIFMALKNSKTGSLPVSEIYSFMTEHFPYFKTAPDGWKNSVRHNLSLNKCFEKVENKNGNSSRKGCLWSLNPARVEKMQEELHKWRRKDPLTVRRSMARPEDLDHLLGEKPSKQRQLPPYPSPSLASRVAPAYGAPSAPPPPPPPPPGRAPHFLPAPPPPQQPSYRPPHSSYGGGPQPPGLHSPAAGKMPPAYGVSLQAECGGARRSVQELLLLEGELTYDVDTLNPSLTDLQLQGNLWEELREDSLASDSQPVSSAGPLPPADPRLYTSCVQAAFPVGHGTEPPPPQPPPHCRAEESGRGASSETDGCASGLQGAPYSGMEGLSGFLTCCTTSISLM